MIKLCPSSTALGLHSKHYSACVKIPLRQSPTPIVRKSAIEALSFSVESKRLTDGYFCSVHFFGKKVRSETLCALNERPMSERIGTISTMKGAILEPSFERAFRGVFGRSILIVAVWHTPDRPYNRFAKSFSAIDE